MKTLNNILLLNSVSSGATGLLMVIFSSAVADLFGVSSSTPFLATGIFLLAFAILVFAEARTLPHDVRRVRLIITMDVLWVIGSIFILVLHPLTFTVVGNALIAAVALWVAGMAYFQFVGLKQLSASSR